MSRASLVLLTLALATGGWAAEIKRVPWDTSRVVGSPEPPLPYATERIFEQIEFERPLYAAMLPGTDRLLVVQQPGHVLSFANRADAKDAQDFLKLEDHDSYSLCFHPRFAQNRYVYLFANGPNSERPRQNRILRFEVSREEPFVCRLETQTVIIEWESNGHNGGEMAFGPDGMLYISSGDGTSDSDGDLTGQNLGTLTSGVLRIDVDHPAEGQMYRVPDDNPFLHLPDARPELWAYGFRNPWRLCFDPKRGDLWVGDIGQDLWELVHVVQRGGNYGWSVMEGRHPFQPLRQRGPTPILPPTIEHPHSESRSITGGLVYSGRKFASLAGAYLYGDYSTGKVWGARYEKGKVTWRQELADSTLQILGFCEGPAGEVLLVDYSGPIHRLVVSPPPVTSPSLFPRKLSETGLYVDVAAHRMHPAIVSYSVNSPLWSDGAHKERFIALPGLTRMQHQDKNAWKFPEGTVLVKTFSLERTAGDSASRQRIETRLLTLQQNEWVGYSYRWNEQQTDAELVEAAGADREVSLEEANAAGGEHRQTWRYPSRAECMICHTRAAGFVLGLSTLQMNREHDYGEFRENQLALLARSEFLDFPGKKAKPDATEANPPPARMPKPPEEYPRLADPYDTSADLAARARSYLHANCAHCHVKSGGGNAAINLHQNTTDENLQALGVAPLHDKFEIPDARLVAPGEPRRSVLLHRVAKTGRGRMPPLSTTLVDEPAVELLKAWIESLKPAP